MRDLPNSVTSAESAPTSISPKKPTPDAAAREFHQPLAVLVEHDESLIEQLSRLIEVEGFSVLVTRSLDEARATLADRLPSLILLNLHLPDGTGLDLFKEMREAPSVEAVLIAGEAESVSAVESLHLGAFEYVRTPIRPAEARRVLANVRRTLRFRGEIGTLRQELRLLGRFGCLTGASPAMQRVYDMVTRVAPTEASVLLTGESGTGKELVARTIHDLSPRRDGPFLAINCGAVASSMIENELFGHEKGSFTGATQAHAGIFERANGGTLLLDEIAEMNPELQVELLRVLETATLMRVGGEREVKVDVRVIAATNRNPESAIAEGKLREDLFYRLRVLQLHLPPLRDRAGDIGLLADDVLRELNREAGLAKTFSKDAMAAIEGHSWPGNVRELKNVIRAAFILSDTEIQSGSLALGSPAASPVPSHPGPSAAGPSTDLVLPVGMTSLAEAERRLIAATIDFCGGNRVRAARCLGVSRKTIYNRMRPEPRVKEAAG